MTVNENFLMHYILSSLLFTYGLFQMNYNTTKDKWNVHVLHDMSTQEETRLRVCLDWGDDLRDSEWMNLKGLREDCGVV